MYDGNAPPNEADFTKTLSAVLLAEYLGVVGAHALCIAGALASPAAARAASIVDAALFIAVLGMNLSTMAAAAAMRRDPAHAPLANSSLAMTAGQVVILVASWLSQNLVLLGAAAAMTAVALAATLAFSQGKFLRPPS